MLKVSALYHAHSRATPAPGVALAIRWREAHLRLGAALFVRRPEVAAAFPAAAMLHPVIGMAGNNAEFGNRLYSPLASSTRLRDISAHLSDARLLPGLGRVARLRGKSVSEMTIPLEMLIDTDDTGRNPVPAAETDRIGVADAANGMVVEPSEVAACGLLGCSGSCPLTLCRHPASLP